jgi:hypothetical protein
LCFTTKGYRAIEHVLKTTIELLPVTEEAIFWLMEFICRYLFSGTAPNLKIPARLSHPVSLALA